MDGVQVDVKAGVNYFPAANEFQIGNDSYSETACGRFDELETFDYPLTTTRVTADYQTIVTRDSDNNGLPDFWERINFGHLGVDPNADPDGDGFSNLQEYQMGTNPNVTDPNIITFALSIPNTYINTNLVNPGVTVLEGVPFFYSVLVDSTNFSDAIWSTYTSSNILVDITTNPGPHSVWIGLRGYPTSSQQTWQETNYVLDYTLPVLAITSPASQAAFNADRVNVGGNYSCNSLKQINVNGVPAFLNGTNFEAVNVSLAPGINLLTASAENWNGSIAYVSITVFAQTNADGSLNNPVSLQATPVGGFVPLPVTFSVQTNVPGTILQVLYDFNGDDLADFATNNLDSFTYTYTTNGEYFPVTTIQTTVGRFASSGGWNSSAANLLRVNVSSQPILLSTISITDPVDLKATAAGELYILSRCTATITEYGTNGSASRSLAAIGSNPSGLDVDAAGNVYVAVTGGNQVKKFLPTSSSFQADTSFGFGGCIGLTNGAILRHFRLCRDNQRSKVFVSVPPSRRTTLVVRPRLSA